MTLPFPVVLASASPRRRQLLAEIVPTFTVAVSDVDEEALTVDDPVVTAERLAQAKARAVARLHPEALVIGGDTVVAIPDPNSGRWEQLAKPRDAADARRMLRRLSGDTHRVITGLALVWPEGEEVLSDVTSVAFRPLDEEEIAAYVETGEPMDKAGAYAIQGGAAAFVASVEGSRSNVIGLPQEALAHALSRRFHA